MSQSHRKVTQLFVKFAIKHHRKLANRYNREGRYGMAEVHALRAEEMERELEDLKLLEQLSARDLTTFIT